jgi:hypothetical protein
VEDCNPSPSKASQDHPQLEDDVLACSVPLAVFFPDEVALVVRCQEDASEADVAVLTQVVLKLLDDGVAPGGQVREHNRLHSHSQQQQLKPIS